MPIDALAPAASPSRARRVSVVTAALAVLVLLVLGSIGSAVFPAVAGASPGQDAPTTTAPAAAADEKVESIKGTLKNLDDNGKPVAGAEIVVKDEGGKEIGTATSEADGTFLLELPGPGNYTAELQLDSLPAGVKLRDAATAKRPFRLTPGQSKPMAFVFGKDTTVAVTTLDKIPGTLLDGARLGLIIAMTAIGLSLIYGTTQFTNFAHGEAVTFGALITWYLNVEAGLPLIGAAAIAVALSGLVGLLLDAGLWAPLRRKKTGPFSLMVVSFGLSIALLAGFQFFYGARNRPYAEYAIQPPLFKLGNQNVPPRTIVTMVLSVVVLGAVGLFLQKARFGKAMRAVADNGPLASASGINTDRVVRLVWVLGTALAALGGILYSLDQGVKVDEGQTLLLLMFAGITLGGLGTSFGAAAGCFLLGVAIQFSTLWIPTSLKSVGALVILIIVLMFKPQGVFGRRERVG